MDAHLDVGSPSCGQMDVHSALQCNGPSTFHRPHSILPISEFFGVAVGGVAMLVRSDTFSRESRIIAETIQFGHLGIAEHVESYEDNSESDLFFSPVPLHSSKSVQIQNVCPKVQGLAPERSVPIAQCSGIVPTFVCCICLCRERLRYAVQAPGCQHQFCFRCITGYLKSEITDGETALQCPFLFPGEKRCPTMLKPADVKAFILEPQVLKRYTRFHTLKSNPAFQACPNCDHIQRGEADHPWMTCCKCQFSFCFAHGSAHSPDETCVDFEKRHCAEVDQILSEEYIDRISQPCPKCHVPTYKYTGCNHMTCSRCKEEWCWLCGESISNVDEHYSSLGSPCDGRQFERDGNEEGYEGSEGSAEGRAGWNHFEGVIDYEYEARAQQRAWRREVKWDITWGNLPRSLWCAVTNIAIFICSIIILSSLLFMSLGCFCALFHCPSRRWLRETIKNWSCRSWWAFADTVTSATVFLFLLGFLPLYYVALMLTLPFWLTYMLFAGQLRSFCGRNRVRAWRP